MAAPMASDLPHFEPADRQALREQLAATLSPEILAELRRWVALRVSRSMQPIHAVVDRRDDLGGAAPPAGSLASEVQRALHEAQPDRDYEAVLERLGRTTPGGLVERYRLPADLVEGLRINALGPVRGCAPELDAHARAVEDHDALMAEVTRAPRTGLALAASMAGGLLARFGSRPAPDRLESRIRASRQRLEQSLAAFSRRYRASAAQARENLEHLLMAIYGGLLERLQEDLRRVGRSLVLVDLDAGRLELAMSPSERAAQRAWARGIARRLEALAETGAWRAVGEAADRALGWMLDDPARARSLLDDDGASYAVTFARHRARALAAVADEAWQRGETIAACEIIRHLLTGSNVAWQAGDPDDVLLATAGLRLVVACTATEEISEEPLEPVPGFVAQALARRGDGDPTVRLPGEQVTTLTRWTAFAVERYARRSGLLLGLEAQLPQPVRLCEGLGPWRVALEHAWPDVDLQALEGLVRDCTTPLQRRSSAFFRWLVRERRGRWHAEVSRVCGRAMFAIVPVALVVWWWLG